MPVQDLFREGREFGVGVKKNQVSQDFSLVPNFFLNWNKALMQFDGDSALLGLKTAFWGENFRLSYKISGFFEGVYSLGASCQGEVFSWDLGADSDVASSSNLKLRTHWDLGVGLEFASKAGFPPRLIKNPRRSYALSTSVSGMLVMGDEEFQTGIFMSWVPYMVFATPANRWSAGFYASTQF